MSVPRLILVGCLAALAAGLFGYFVLFEPDESPSSAVPTTIDSPASPPTSPPPSTTTAPPRPDPETTTSASTTTSAAPGAGRGRNQGKDNKQNEQE